MIRPDLEAISQGTPGALQSYFVPKTIDSYDVICETDEEQFSKLRQRQRRDNEYSLRWTRQLRGPL